MSTLAYVDAVAGVAGDMLLGALLDAGADAEYVRAGLRSLPLDGLALETSMVTRQGITARRVSVLGQPEHHIDRSWADVRGLLERAALPARALERAHAVFAALARAEGAVHDVAPEAVRFHEVGALDAIGDVCGIALALEDLGVDEMACSPLPAPRGLIGAAHGRLPLPAPATLELLRGAPLCGVDLEVELVTPTGAAVVAALAVQFGPLPPMHLKSVGYGAGTRELEQLPNVVRVLVGERDRRGGEGGGAHEEVMLIETNLDDLSPELVPDAAERCFAAGALDVWVAAAQMKKGRPGIVFSALARPGDERAVAETILRETTTLGVRVSAVRRWELAREWVSVEVDGEPIRVKLGFLDGQVINAAPEHGDCVAAARQTGRPVKELWAGALAAVASGERRRDWRGGGARARCTRGRAGAAHPLARQRGGRVLRRRARRGELLSRAWPANSSEGRVKVRLAYGSGGLDVEFPASRTTVVQPTHHPGAADELGELRAAMRAPVAGPPLREIVRPGQSVAISMCDGTRAQPRGLMIPAVLEKIAGVIDLDAIVILVATGSHRPNTAAEIREMLGDLVDRVRVVNHDARDRESLVFLGERGDGVPVWINRRWVAADVRISTGFVEPHFFAGFSGGAKMVTPGLAGLETILVLHDAARISHPKATWAITVGNPVHDDIRASAAAAPPHFSLDVILNREQRVISAFAGELEPMHRAACEAAREYAMQPVAAPFDVVVTSNSGFPLDQNLYQAVKGMSAAAKVVKPGGLIVCAAECRDGFPGHGHYRELLASHASPRALIDAITSAPTVIQDQWQVQVQANIQAHATVVMHTDHLSDEELSEAHLPQTHDIAATVREELERRGPGATVCVLPEGPQTIPCLAAG